MYKLLDSVNLKPAREISHIEIIRAKIPSFPCFSNQNLENFLYILFCLQILQSNNIPRN